MVFHRRQLICRAYFRRRQLLNSTQHVLFWIIRSLHRRYRRPMMGTTSAEPMMMILGGCGPQRSLSSATTTGVSNAASTKNHALEINPSQHLRRCHDHFCSRHQSDVVVVVVCFLAARHRCTIIPTTQRTRNTKQRRRCHFATSTKWPFAVRRLPFANGRNGRNERLEGSECRSLNERRTMNK